MASDYPGGLDSFDTIAADKKTSDAVGGRTHRQMHNDLGDAIEAVQAELGVNPSGSAATVVARLDAAEGRIGNLLTANQASLETDTTGWGDTANCTIHRNTGLALVGAASLDMVSSAAGDVLAQTTVAGIPVSAGATYTAVASFVSGAVSRTARVGIQWFDSGGSWIAAVSGSAVTTTIGAAWGESMVTAVAPSNAVTANVYVTVQSCAAASEYHFVDRIGIWAGSGGQWAMPGTPIVHTGIRPNPSNTAEVQIWNDATATWITV